MAQIQPFIKIICSGFILPVQGADWNIIAENCISFQNMEAVLFFGVQ